MPCSIRRNRLYSLRPGAYYTQLPSRFCDLAVVQVKVHTYASEKSSKEQSYAFYGEQLRLAKQYSRLGINLKMLLASGGLASGTLGLRIGYGRLGFCYHWKDSISRGISFLLCRWSIIVLVSARSCLHLS
jgi:hypothetical protein